MIGTIAVIATIADKKKEVQRSQRSQRSYGNHSPEIAARIVATTIVEIEKVLSQLLLSLRSLNLFFSAIAVIVAIIWKPGFTTVTNRWRDLQQASRGTGRLTRRIGPRRSFTLGYLGLEPTTTLHAQAYLTFFGRVLCCQCMATTRHTAYNFTFYRERKQKKTNLSLVLSLPLDIVLVTIIENTVQLRGIQWRLFSHLQVFL